MADSPPPLLYLNADAVRRALPMSAAIEAMRTAFIELAEGGAKVPERIHLDVEPNKGVALFMPAHSPACHKLAVKVVTLFEGNPGRGLERIQGQVVLLDDQTGQTLAILDGKTLTAIRTGAVSGLATDLLARPDARTVAIFGAGVQARTQLEAVCAVRDIEKAKVFARSAVNARRFAEEMTKERGIEVIAATSSTDALSGADIVCTATTSSSPVFEDDDLPKSVHINAVGSYQPEVREIPQATVIRARIVVDQRYAALAEAGELIQPIKRGALPPSAVNTELGQLLISPELARHSPSNITLFKSVGLAIQDVHAASAATCNAASQNIGQRLVR